MQISLEKTILYLVCCQLFKAFVQNKSQHVSMMSQRSKRSIKYNMNMLSLFQDKCQNHFQTFSLTKKEKKIKKNNNIKNASKKNLCQSLSSSSLLF